jgi:hypothetical protein
MEPLFAHSSGIQTQELDIDEGRNRSKGRPRKDSDMIYGHKEILMGDHPSVGIRFVPEDSFETLWG